MKRTALLILIAALFFMLLSGCGEDSPVQENNKQTLTLSGQLPNWTHGDSLRLVLTNENGTNPQYFLASANISSEGMFKLIASLPSTELLSPVAEIYNTEEYSAGDVVISDSSAKFFRGYLAVLEGGKFWGLVQWTDFLSIDQTAQTWKYYRAAYFYFDKDVEIKGTAYCPSCRGGALVLNVSAKAGWNTILYGVNQNFVGSYEDYKPINGYYDYSMIRSAPIYPIPKDSLIIYYPQNY
ncbi:MAG TPA: hypothetical protein VHP30_04025 [Ignavibacteriales bacterium]|nr:hypothetical protein [Ignavibacteriales bacterium]